jgi:2'-5' RNA ligase
LRYLVAHLLSGSARAFHLSLARELSHRFHTVPVHEKTPAHLTLKPPFEADEERIAEVERVLRAFAASERSVPFSLAGFGRFGFRTVYIDVPKSSEAIEFSRRAIETLNRNIPWLPRYPREGNKLHASVARFMSRKQFRRVWRFVRSVPYPRFESSLDEIAILKREGGAWKIHALIPLPSARGDEYAGYAFPRERSRPELVS